MSIMQTMHASSRRDRLLWTWALCALSAVVLLLYAVPASAHANLERADPAPNTRLTDPPASIHLTFTEPVEPGFARLGMRDSAGSSFANGDPQVSADGFSVTLALPDTLPDGVYTVDWRVVSSTDGHPTRGGYPLIIGDATAQVVTVTNDIDTPIPIDTSLVRALNLIALALVGGVPLFALAVWRPFVRAARRSPGELAFDDRAGSRRLWLVMWIGWVLTGIASALLLANQTQVLTGVLTVEALAQTVFESRYGLLWLARMALWGLYGASVLFAVRRLSARAVGVLSLLAGGIFLAQSVYSHAAGAESNSALYITADLLHLVAMAAWLGGLAALLALIPLFRVTAVQAPALGGLMARFSNLARVAVALLLVTGVIAGLLQIGSLTALLTTDYGIALVIKLALFAPTLAIAALNLIVTQRRLRAGVGAWRGRLRRLVMLEGALLVGALAAVGVMTSIPPARVTLAARQDAASVTFATAATGFFEMIEQGSVMTHLTIDPGIVGENTFTIELLQAVELTPIADATLIRLRFQHTTENLGESELRMVHAGDGIYTVTGANLSVPGTWRIRATIQRPGEFDTVIDFYPTVGTATIALAPAPATLSSAPANLVRAPARLYTIVPTRGLDDVPWLLTEEGALLRPVADGAWAPMPFDSPIRAAYVGLGDILWIVADSGVYRLPDGSSDWQRVGDATGADRIVSTHGYLFALGGESILRIGEGGLETDSRQLGTPESGVTARDLTMLADHSHALLNGNDVYRTTSVGLAWTPLDAPADVLAITADADENLLAVTPGALLEYDLTRASWRTRATWTASAAPSDPVPFQGNVYAIADGAIVRIARDTLIPALPDMPAVMVDLAFIYPAMLWAIDVDGTLYSTADGSAWQLTRGRGS